MAEPSIDVHSSDVILTSGHTCYIKPISGQICYVNGIKADDDLDFGQLSQEKKITLYFNFNFDIKHNNGRFTYPNITGCGGINGNIIKIGLDGYESSSTLEALKNNLSENEGSNEFAKFLNSNNNINKITFNKDISLSSNDFGQLPTNISSNIIDYLNTTSRDATTAKLNELAVQYYDEHYKNFNEYYTNLNKSNVSIDDCNTFIKNVMNSIDDQNAFVNEDGNARTYTIKGFKETLNYTVSLTNTFFDKINDKYHNAYQIFTQIKTKQTNLSLLNVDAVYVNDGYTLTTNYPEIFDCGLEGCTFNFGSTYKGASIDGKTDDVDALNSKFTSLANEKINELISSNIKSCGIENISKLEDFSTITPEEIGLENINSDALSNIFTLISMTYEYNDDENDTIITYQYDVDQKIKDNLNKLISRLVESTSTAEVYTEE